MLHILFDLFDISPEEYYVIVDLVSLRVGTLSGDKVSRCQTQYCAMTYKMLSILYISNNVDL